MIEIEKRETYPERNGGYYRFTISTDEGKFYILYAGVLDVYWGYDCLHDIRKEPDSKSFTITKENYYFYSLLEELYSDVKNCNIFQLDDIDTRFYKNTEEIETKRKDNARWNHNLKKYQKHDPHRLFQNGAIKWHSDDFTYDAASFVRIAKKREKFLITFAKSQEEDHYQSYSVRFRNSGSRYDPFNLLFMKMYNKLVDYDPNYHQIHIEEYLYQKKLEKKLK